ncbi:HamA C-terminal domain-containing protein [Rhizobium leguminosarum]|uniref:HamA C-terminal domain-containing protein n=1 Tax=Rhizobium leguminosarum TaxID=384 RepID=UPI00036FFD69|nr:DUF1837 domain-containing protein [Rhizobium leguminosarum]MBY5826460.1 DUF1837 domain-containing protein [Rhizobium leguminosarum]NKN02836.1 DUF1837 domain-containing protein [Rhizobium leguminosarum bv. viciae]
MDGDTDNLQRLFRSLERGGGEQLDAFIFFDKENKIEIPPEITLSFIIPQVDINGTCRTSALIEFLQTKVVDFCFGRKIISAAKKKDDIENSTRNTLALYRKAKVLFSEIKTSGEGGEVLLFCLAELALGFPQLISKFQLKTSGPMHVHGSDGVFICAAGDVLHTYWGESKLHEKISSSVPTAIQSISQYLTEPLSLSAEKSEDILLITSQEQLEDPNLQNIIKSYFDSTEKNSLNNKNCSVCLCGFDQEQMYSTPISPQKMKDDLSAKIADWTEYLKQKIVEGNIADREVHFSFCR